MATYNSNTSGLMAHHDRGKFYAIPKEIGQLYGLLPGFDIYCEKVYAVLRDRANEHNEAWPSIYTLMVETGFSASTIKRRLKLLREYELIESKPRIDGNGNLYNVYEPLSESQFLREFPQVTELYQDRKEKAEKQREKDMAGWHK